MAKAKKTPVKKKASRKHSPDVAKPGVSAPSLTSKPVLVTNRPIIKDPMMVADVPGVPQSEVSHTLSAPLLPGTHVTTLHKPAVKPIVDNSAAPQISEMIARAAQRKSAASSKPAVIPPATGNEETDLAEFAVTTPKPLAIVPQPAPPVMHDVKPVKKVIQPAEKPVTAIEKAPVAVSLPGTKEADTADDAERDIMLQKLVDTKKYFLPINAVEKRRAKQFVALGVLLSLLLAAAWLDIALDAHLIQLSGIKPLTHFFST